MLRGHGYHSAALGPVLAPSNPSALPLPPQGLLLLLPTQVLLCRAETPPLSLPPTLPAPRSVWPSRDELLRAGPDSHQLLCPIQARRTEELTSRQPGCEPNLSTPGLGLHWQVSKVARTT